MSVARMQTNGTVHILGCMRRSSRRAGASPFAACIILLAALSPCAAAQPGSGSITVEYVAPKNPDHQALYEMLKERHALEQLQKIFSPLRLPSDLVLRSTGCDGAANAWYQRGALTVCYEYLDGIRRMMPKETTAAGVSPHDAVIGQFMYVVGHEMGHAVFDLLNVPVFGRAEDAADQFATYLMLRLGKDQARRLIGGAAYTFNAYLQEPTVTVPLKAFSDEHSPPAARFYNMMCLAYGADPNTFADVLEKQYLPKQRIGGCQREYGEVAYAFQRLIEPYVDRDLAKTVMDEDWLKQAPR
jgi:hypothetical protein